MTAWALPTALVLLGADYLGWRWATGGGEVIPALITGLTMPALAIALGWIVLAVALGGLRKLGAEVRRHTPPTRKGATIVAGELAEPPPPEVPPSRLAA